MNRLEDYLRDPHEPDPQSDFYEIESHYDSFAVSLETAIEIERRLDELPPPRWVVFRDLSGARQRVLAAQIYRISESTAAQRRADREFARARRLEEKKERRPWEEDD